MSCSCLRGALLGALLGLSPALGAAPAEEPPTAGPLESHDITPPVQQLPAGVLLVKGAWSSASDSTTPLPEGGVVEQQRYSNAYFGFSVPLLPGWIQKFQGPPPSDTGYYVLAQLRPADTSRSSRGTVLITAQDMFFTPTGAHDPLDLVRYASDHLDASLTVEQAPRQVAVAGRSFVTLAYSSHATGLHWQVLATQIRCHTVQFVFTSRDRRLIDDLIATMKKMDGDVPGDTDDGDVPVCIQGYASAAQVLERVEPFFTERRFNPVPVRVIIDEHGKVKHIHFISAFPDQARSITDALTQWRFRPYLSNGHPVEVETGILFGPHQGETGTSQ
jgi:hypothetical protein